MQSLRCRTREPRHLAREYLFNAITDEEYYTYMALLRDAVEQEKGRLRDRRATTTMRRFFNWLSDLSTRESDAIHQSGS